MANLPRPGIINLDFADVSRMAQDIQANDPLRQLLGQGSQFLRTRDDRIKYDRALAELEGRDISDESTTTGEGVGKAYDWLKKNSGKAYDTVKEYGSKIVPTDFTFKNPFVTEEVAYEEGDRIESPIFDGEMSREDGLAGGMSREDTMSRLPAPMQTGTKTIFPTTVVGKDRKVEATRGEEGKTTSAPYLDEYQNELAGGMSRESDGMTKFSPEGERVSFPTTVVGAEIASPVEGREVSATKLEAPMAVKRPRSDAEIWSELNRLNSQRAGFDYNRIKAEQQLANEVSKKVTEQKEKSDINSPVNIKEMAVQFRNYAGLIGSTNWNNFSDTQKKDILAGYKGLHTQLAKTELGRALIGQVEAETPDAKNIVDTDKTTTTGLDNEGLTQQIKNQFATLDKPETETIENLGIIKKTLEEARKKAGVSETDTDYIMLKQFIDDTAKERAEFAREKYTKGKESRAEQLDKSEKAADYGLMVSGLETLKNKPSDATTLNSVLTSLLRIESGASIGSDEYVNRAKDYMSPEDYESFVNELSSPILALKDKILSGTAKNDIMRIQSKYIAKMNADKIIKNATLVVPEEYYKINKRRINEAGGSGGKSTNEPTRKNNESITEFRKRYNEWKQGKK